MGLAADSGALGVPPTMPEERQHQRLQAWIERELRSLLQTNDVAIVRAYVMGLVRGIGFSSSAAAAHDPAAAGPAASNAASQAHSRASAADTAAAASAGGSGAAWRGTEHQDAAAALRPFLLELAEHFWHELRWDVTSTLCSPSPL